MNYLRLADFTWPSPFLSGSRVFELNLLVGSLIRRGCESAFLDPSLPDSNEGHDIQKCHTRKSQKLVKVGSHFVVMETVRFRLFWRYKHRIRFMRKLIDYQSFRLDFFKSDTLFSN
ncbi:hypothetical protein vseg_012966 [Gypsophila vaccaria]